MEEDVSVGWYYLMEDHSVYRVPMADDVYYKWFSGEGNRKVALDTVGEARVSTVFLGLDHGWFGGPPILFETMIFGGEHSDYQERYHTWDEAVEGHKRVVEALQEGREP